MKARLIAPTIALLLGAGLGTWLGVKLATEPGTRHETTTMCARCGLHRTLTRVDTHLGPGAPVERIESGILVQFLYNRAGHHEHAWMEPPVVVLPSELPEDLAPEARFSQELIRFRLGALQSLETSPRAVALLDEAFKNDPEKAGALAERLVDPENHLDPATLLLLDREGVPWEKRWAILDAFLQNYRCSRQPTAITCTLTTQGTPTTLFRMDLNGHSWGAIHWQSWTP